MDTPFRLTSLAHGGGCGCKLAPSVLRQLLGGAVGSSIPRPFERLLVGVETGDDAAVWRVEGDTCVIATTDFFMPIVDDPRDFGRIAATNAISDIYAMGGTPLMALAILGVPLEKISLDVVREILAGGAEACGLAGIPVAGGHSIDSPEPIYGLAVIGTCKAGQLRRNSTAQDGDALILTKPIGVGVYSAALKKGVLSEEGYAEMVATTTRLNRIGSALAQEADVHAMTDVTGFGLLGHALEVARGSALGIELNVQKIPLLTQAEALAREGCVTGASTRNWMSYGESVVAPDDLPLWRRHLLTDPQTSGGLLVCCAMESASGLLNKICGAGFPDAAIVGVLKLGSARIVLIE
jgi:selenide,water dikinase